MQDAANESEVRLLVLCAGDPNSERAFSGSAKGLINALERRGCVHYKANVLGATDPFARGPLLLRAFRRIDRFGMMRRYRYSSFALNRNSNRARRIARDHPGFNACLMYGTTYRPELDVPTYCYFDATAAQVAQGKGWSYAQFDDATTDRIVAYQQSVFDQCTAICPRTEYAARSVEHDYQVARDRICVAGAGPNHFADAPPHAPYDNQNILFIGREFERKGGPLIVEAFKRVRSEFSEATLTIVGCTPDIDIDGVRIVGPVNKDASGGLETLLKHYSEAAVFCIMSTFEPFGIVVLEAQNSYVPCVVPKRFAFTETVIDGETGRHVPNDDPAALANIFIDLLRDPARLESMGRAGHDFVRREWTWDAAAKRIHDRIAADLAQQQASETPA